MSKTDNIYIKKARRKRLIKRLIGIFIVLVAIGIFVVFKTDMFLINKVECKGDDVVTGDYIRERTNKLKGENIFTFDKDGIILELKKNPYVKKVEITRTLPKKIIINVVESKGLFYIVDGTENGIISSDLRLLERSSNIDTSNLIEIKGIDISNVKIGDTIDKDTRLNTILNELYDQQGVIKDYKEDFLITSVNLGDLSNIKVYLNNIEVRVGTDENLRSKMNGAVAVYKSGLATEYIDVSFKGTPDFK